MNECIVCGKPRFMIDGVPRWFFPLVCSWKCLKTDPKLFAILENDGDSDDLRRVEILPTDGGP